MSRAAEQLEALLALMRTLRDPVGGCPWDREQTFETIAPYTIEEAYEVADAIARADLDRLRDELGDLFQVVFHARMAEERGQFDFADVAQGIREKLVRRHPHVFEAAPAQADSSTLRHSWEAQKAGERAARGAGGVLADVPTALPALTRAAKLGKRAGRVGFDWEAATGVRIKIDEELAELDRAVKTGTSDQVAEELGDLLFTVANWARHLELDAEEALRAASLKFERRFESMESQAQQAQLRLETLSAAQWEQLWVAAKSLSDKR
jgi:ATP diphosphatase